MRTEERTEERMEKERVPTPIPRMKAGVRPSSLKEAGGSPRAPTLDAGPFLSSQPLFLWEAHLKCPHFMDGETELQCQSRATSLDSGDSRCKTRMQTCQLQDPSLRPSGQRDTCPGAETENTEASGEHCPRAVLEVTPRGSSEPVPTQHEEHQGTNGREGVPAGPDLVPV